MIEEDGPGAGALIRTGPTDWFGTRSRGSDPQRPGRRARTPAAIEVGIESVTPELSRERCERAARVALSAGDAVSLQVGVEEAGTVAIQLRGRTRSRSGACGRGWRPH